MILATIQWGQLSVWLMPILAIRPMPATKTRRLVIPATILEHREGASVAKP